jgi:hypothetical protein
MMGKRSSNFERQPRGLYPTPVSATLPLLPHLPKCVRFDEPCAGDGALVNNLVSAGHVLTSASDIHPMASGIIKRDALDINKCHGDIFITNPPWPEPNRRGDPALEILMHLSSLAPTWLLLPGDFSYNIYFNKVAAQCQKIVAIGRVKWIPGSKYPGKDNAAWYLFDGSHAGQISFHARTGGLKNHST